MWGSTRKRKVPLPLVLVLRMAIITSSDFANSLTSSHVCITRPGVSRGILSLAEWASDDLAAIGWVSVLSWTNMITGLDLLATAFPVIERMA
nr:hypothetical protein CFP56_36403 [Quercus suber]